MCSNSKIYPFISRMPEHKVTDLQKPHLISTGSLRRARPGDKRSKSTYCQDSYSSGLSSLFEEWSSRTQAAWTKLLMVPKCKSGPYPNHLINIPFQLLSSPLVRGCVWPHTQYYSTSKMHKRWVWYSTKYIGIKKKSMEYIMYKYSGRIKTTYKPQYLL